MELYLVQHGEAVPEEADPDRPLSDRGRADVEGVASFLARNHLEVAGLAHSGKTRARQTAEILAAALGRKGASVEVAGLKPNDPIEPWVEKAARWTEPTMLVGHLPFMGKLASRLVAGDETANVVRFECGTVVCLTRNEDSEWSVAWMIPPGLLHD